MSRHADLYAFLSSQGSLVSLVGDRIYPLQLPESTTLPALVYERISGVRSNRTQSSSGPVQPRIRFHCWGNTPDAAEALGDALVNLIDGRDAIGTFRKGTIDTDFDLIDPDTGRIHRVVECLAWENVA